IFRRIIKKAALTCSCLLEPVLFDRYFFEGRITGGFTNVASTADFTTLRGLAGTTPALLIVVAQAGHIGRLAATSFTVIPLACAWLSIVTSACPFPSTATSPGLRACI